MDSLDDGMRLVAFILFQAEDNTRKGEGCRSGDGKSSLSPVLEFSWKTASRYFLFILKRLVHDKAFLQNESALLLRNKDSVNLSDKQ